MTPHPLSAQVQTFFTARLANQLGASPNTVASYRDTFRLLLVFASTETGRNARPTCGSRTSMRSLLVASSTTSKAVDATAPAPAMPG